MNQDFSFSLHDQQICSHESKEALSLSSEGNAPYEKKDIQMDAGRMYVFNFALYKNGIPPIRGIQIINNTGMPIRGLFLKITSDFAFFHPFESELPEIPYGKRKAVKVNDSVLVINGKMLSELTETVIAMITLELLQNGETICSFSGEMKVLANDQWHDSESYRNGGRGATGGEW